jgi:hypothetical protein
MIGRGQGSCSFWVFLHSHCSKHVEVVRRSQSWGMSRECGDLTPTSHAHARTMHEDSLPKSIGGVHYQYMRVLTVLPSATLYDLKEGYSICECVTMGNIGKEHESNSKYNARRKIALHSLSYTIVNKSKNRTQNKVDPKRNNWELAEGIRSFFFVSFRYCSTISVFPPPPPCVEAVVLKPRESALPSPHFFLLSLPPSGCPSERRMRNDCPLNGKARKQSSQDWELSLRLTMECEEGGRQSETLLATVEVLLYTTSVVLWT